MSDNDEAVSPLREYRISVTPEVQACAVSLAARLNTSPEVALSRLLTVTVQYRSLLLAGEPIQPEAIQKQRLKTRAEPSGSETRLNAKTLLWVVTFLLGAIAAIIVMLLN